MVRVFPAFFLAVLLTAAQAGAAPAAQSAAAQKAKPKKAKKVWTNEDLEQLRSTTPISVLSASAAPAATPSKGAGEATAGSAEKAAATGAPYEKGKDPQWYRQRIGSLRAELERIDNEILRLRNFLENPSKGQAGLTLGQENARLSPANQIELLERRREEVRRQMDELEDDARRNGISPSVLR